MRKAKDIYNETVNEVITDGNQSLHNMAITAIEKTQKEMFDFLYGESQKDEYKELSLAEFFDVLDSTLLFSYDN